MEEGESKGAPRPIRVRRQRRLTAMKERSRWGKRRSAGDRACIRGENSNGDGERVAVKKPPL